MPFLEVEFPRDIALGAQGGPEWLTLIATSAAGYEQRNKSWADPRRVYDVSHAYRDRSTFEKLQAFFLNVGGRWAGFRFFDHKDYQFTDEVCPNISGDTFQIQKTYTIAGNTYTRPITKPITGSVKNASGASLANTVTVYVDGTPTAATVDHETGIITVSAGSPAGVVTASGQFHVPVRFDTDKMNAQADTPGDNLLVTWGQISVMEIRI